MKYDPYEYQQYATNYILQRPISAILLDMGLGKSVITLTAIFNLALDSFLIRKVLIIAPLRVARDTWPTEIRKWDHLKGLKYAAAIGSAAERRAALRQKADVYLINRENVKWLVHESGLPFDYQMVVIDELSSFKSHRSERFKALRRIRPSVHRIVGLTGTPSPNGLMDIWAQIGILDMGQWLGRYIGGYRERYFVPDKRNRQVVFSYKPKEGAEDAIYERISDIAISMKSMGYIAMPELMVNNVEVEMSSGEMALYKKLKKDLILPFEDGDIDAASAVGLSNKLLQMANGAVYDENGGVRIIHGRKLDI
jgi:SNF2 family DNA or RNA helicase